MTMLRQDTQGQDGGKRGEAERGDGLRAQKPQGARRRLACAFGGRAPGPWGHPIPDFWPRSWVSSPRFAVAVPPWMPVSVAPTHSSSGDHQPRGGRGSPTHPAGEPGDCHTQTHWVTSPFPACSAPEDPYLARQGTGDRGSGLTSSRNPPPAPDTPVDDITGAPQAPLLRLMTSPRPRVRCSA